MRPACILLCLFLVSAPVAWAGEPRVIEGIVSSVHDGDTLRIGNQGIRLWGIDAAELEQQCGDVACGENARAALARLSLGFPVTCTVKGKSYKRLVAQCHALGLDLAQAMAQSGMAFAEDRYSHGFYRADELKARAHGTGLWSLASVEIPAHWRACNLPGRKRPADCA